MKFAKSSLAIEKAASDDKSVRLFDFLELLEFITLNLGKESVPA